MKKFLYAFVLIMSFASIISTSLPVYAVQGDGYSEIGGGSGKKKNTTHNTNPAPNTEATTEAVIEDIVKDIITLEQDSQLVVTIITSNPDIDFVFINPANEELKEDGTSIISQTIDNGAATKTKLYTIVNATAGTWKIKYPGVAGELDINTYPTPIVTEEPTTEEVNTETTTEATTEITTEATTEVTTEATTKERQEDKLSNKTSNDFIILLVFSYILCAVVFFVGFKVYHVIKR